MKRITVNLPDDLWEVIETNLKGKLGNKDGEIIRNIVIAWLSDKSYLKKEKER
jgi:metal-responsive CopG/Arc/MetJ family transcriptional regulator